MKRRVRILHPGYLVGTKGHSVLKKKTYIRKPLIEVDEFSYSKMPTSRRHEIDSLGSFHNAAAFSNAVMDDSYDLQAQSRGRDHRLMTQMNNALVSTDFTRAPKSAVAVLRASRRRPVLASKPLSIRTTYYPKSKEVPDIGPYYLSSSARYIPGRTKRLLSLYSDYEPNVVFVDSDAYSTLYPRSTKFRPSDPVYIGERVASRPFYRHRYYQPWYSGWRAVARGRYLRSVPRIYYGRAYPLPELNLKALLVGDDKLDDPDRPRLRKPRTRYYADKLNKMDDKEQLSSIMSTPISSSYKASKPPKYRLESRLEPDDLIPKPSTYGTMRDQVRGVQDKLDRHRQLLDRYLEPGSAAAAAASSAADYEADPFLFKRSADLGERITPHANRAPVDSGLGESHAAGGGLSAGRTTEEGGADGTGKVSPLRKKLRKVICKSRHDPTYYDD